MATGDTMVVALKYISIHAPRGGSDSKDAQFSLSIFGKSYKSF